MAQVNEIVQFLDTEIPKGLQEEYDNVGLLIGSGQGECTGILTTLDITEEVIQEAIHKGCNLIVAHHPILFKGIKKLNGNNYVERIIIKAIQHGLHLYACHTNLDNHAKGVNYAWATLLNLSNIEVLAPKTNSLGKLIAYVPEPNVTEVLEALFQAGAGHIGNYDACSFQSTGTGSFRPLEGSEPTVGSIGNRSFVQESKVEVVYPLSIERNVIKALLKAHPYEEVAYDTITLRNAWSTTGSGCIGTLKEPMEVPIFLSWLCEQMGIQQLKYTTQYQGTIERIALCGGSGSFLLKNIETSGAQAFITSDIKYHDFFEAENKFLVVDLGHYESEIHTKALIKDILTKKFTNIAVYLSEKITNPVGYFTL
ncbi:MAG: Nif3-like dinuclear metal center hexameric protein [Cytophagaceae bacterium]|jgi:dinuclear metal center YbgI/SA1388 family protein|nr:Nif3-like dinuclear metal center hexameric protein [Cytophagaceae bacterium]